MKKTTAVLLLLLSVLPLFAGGGKEDIRTVTIWHSNSGPAGTAFEMIVEDFNEGIGKEQGIEIEAVYQGLANDVLTKVKAAAAADLSSLPDLAELDATACLDMRNASYLVPVAELGADTERILPQALTAFKSERGVLGMPFNCSSLLLYYNKTLFDSLGLEPPETLDEFTAIAPLLGEKDENGTVTRYAFAGAPATYELGAFIGAQNNLSYLVDGKNGHYATPTVTLFDKEGTFKNFLEHWKALYDTGYAENLASGTTDEFASGRAATVLKSSSSLAGLERTVSGRFEIGTAFVPKVDENATGGVNIGGSALFAYSSDEAVRTVVDYLTSEPVQLYWAMETGYMPMNTAVYDNGKYLSFIEANPDYYTGVAQTLASNPEVVGIWIPSGFQIYYSFMTEIRNVTENTKTIDQAVKDMADAVQRAIDDYNSQNID